MVDVSNEVEWGYTFWWRGVWEGNGEKAVLNGEECETERAEVSE